MDNGGVEKASLFPVEEPVYQLRAAHPEYQGLLKSKEAFFLTVAESRWDLRLCRAAPFQPVTEESGSLHPVAP